MIESEIVPYHAERTLEATRVLVLAPHPDDEIFGCGGLIAHYVADRIPVRVIVVSDGGGVPGGEEVRRSYVEQRRQESRQAAQVIGYDDLLFWDYRDREVVYGESLVTDLLAAIADYRPDMLLAPSLFEMHPDHHQLSMAAVESIRRLDDGIRLAMYEVGVPLRPDRLVDISDVMSQKMEAMRCFDSQLASQAYERHIESLNRYRAYTLPQGVVAAEAFQLPDPQRLRHNPIDPLMADCQRPYLALSLHAGLPAATEADSERQKQQLSEMAATVDSLQRQLAASQSALSQTRASTSWRITAPLRALSRLLGRQG